MSNVKYANWKKWIYLKARVRKEKNLTRMGVEKKTKID